MQQRRVLVQFIVSLVASLVATAITSVALGVVLPLLETLTGRSMPAQQPIIVVVVVLAALSFTFYMLRTAIRMGEPKEISLESGGSNTVRRLLPTSPLRMAVLSNFGLAVIFSIAYPHLPVVLFWLVLFFIFLNMTREFFTVHYASREVAEKLINHTLTTLHKCCEQSYRAALPPQTRFNLRANLMLHDEGDDSIGVVRSYNMATDADKSIRFSVNKGIAGHAFRSNTGVNASAITPHAWGFDTHEIAVLRSDLKWMWSYPVRDEHDKPIGVLNVDVNHDPPGEELKVAVAGDAFGFIGPCRMSPARPPHPVPWLARQLVP